MDRSQRREWRDLKPIVIALAILGLVFAGGLVGYSIWQTGRQQHTASQQSSGSALPTPKDATAAPAAR